MTFASFFALLPAILGFAGVQSSGQQPRVTSMIVEHEIIMRVPVRPFTLPRDIEWIEKKGPKCIPAEHVRGAALSGSDHIDFLLIDRQRVRAELDDDCPALDFYTGFYLKREDDRICAKRDTINSRAGFGCEIRKFRRLEAKVKPQNP